MDVDVLLELIKPLQCVVKLKGQALNDLEQNYSLTNIYFIAASLGINNYKSIYETSNTATNNH